MLIYKIVKVNVSDQFTEFKVSAVQVRNQVLRE